MTTLRVTDEGVTIERAPLSIRQYEDWLQESHARERIKDDQIQLLIWQVVDLTERCGQLLGPSRPTWYRRARTWLRLAEWMRPERECR